jgi:hypothetical protein
MHLPQHTSYCWRPGPVARFRAPGGGRATEPLGRGVRGASPGSGGGAWPVRQDVDLLPDGVPCHGGRPALWSGTLHLPLVRATKARRMTTIRASVCCYATYRYHSVTYYLYTSYFSHFWWLPEVTRMMGYLVLSEATALPCYSTYFSQVEGPVTCCDARGLAAGGSKIRG